MARRLHTFIFKRSPVTGISTVYILKNYRHFCRYSDNSYFRRFKILDHFNKLNSILPF